MPRKPRIVIPNRPHHIVIRGNNRRKLFSYASDYQKFLRYLESALDRTNCILHGLSLMSNHVHMNSTPDSKNDLAMMIKHCCQRYAIYRNGRRKGSGKLFEQRYACFPIRDETAMAVTSVYIDLNPWKAGLVVDPADSPWSTYAFHVGKPESSRIPSRIWTPSDWYRSLGPTSTERATRYLELARRFYLGGTELESEAEIEAIATLSRRGYSMRLERPNRERAT